MSTTNKPPPVTVTIDAEVYAHLLDIEQKAIEITEMRRKNKYGEVLKRVRELAVIVGLNPVVGKGGYNGLR